MLERTATSIEPCSSNLQRVFPSPRLFFPSRRKLHTAFWHHGAADFELLDACQALVRLPSSEIRAYPKPRKSNAKPDTMTAPTFLLDFLYPAGTAALLRRPYPLHSIRLESGTRNPPHMSRLFTSAGPLRSDQSGPPPAADESASVEEGAELGEGEEEQDSGEQEVLDHDASADVADVTVGDGTAKFAEEPAALRELLVSNHEGAYDQIFLLYARLDPNLKEDFTTDVLLALSSSSRPTEAWRINELFVRYSADEWTEDLVRAAIKAQLTLHNVPEAMAIFQAAMEQRGFGQGLDFIATYAFELSSWNMLLEAWGIYFKIKGQEEQLLGPYTWYLERAIKDVETVERAAREAEAMERAAKEAEAMEVRVLDPEVDVPASVGEPQQFDHTIRVEHTAEPEPQQDIDGAVEPLALQQTETVSQSSTVAEGVHHSDTVPSRNDERLVDGSGVDELPIGEAVVDQPLVDEAVVDVFSVKDHMAEEPVAGEHVVDEGVVGQLVAGKLVIDESAVEEPVVEDSAVEREPATERVVSPTALGADLAMLPDVPGSTDGDGAATTMNRAAAATDYTTEPDIERQAADVDEASMTAASPEAATHSDVIPDSDFETQWIAARDLADSAAGLTPHESTVTLPAGDAATEQPVLSSFGYPSLATTADFEQKARRLYLSLRDDPETLPQLTALVDSFLRHVLRSSLDLFQPSDAAFMLDRTQDPDCYARYIVRVAGQDRKRLASELYKKYRLLPGVRIADSVLRAMIDVYIPDNVQGMRWLTKDWAAHHGHMDRQAYHKCMAFYAGLGSVADVMRLAEEHDEHYEVSIQADPVFVTTLLNAHAVRGDPETAQKLMEEAVARTGGAPELKHSNILLKACVKAGDYGRAIDLFSKICDEYEPDIYSFGPLMDMAGARGDLQFALELMELAKDRGIQADMRMARALVEAYCQNDRFAEAEALCARLTKKREFVGEYARLWNVLVHHSAKRRDLTGVYRLLELMSSQDIAYNQATYSHLFLGLMYCRQSTHALQLLRVARREGVFEPTADHFIFLMAAFIHSKEPHMALLTNQLMAKWKYHHSALRMTKVIDALGRWRELPPERREGLDGEHFLQLILRHFEKAMQREDRGAPGDIHSVTGLYSKVLFVLTQMREFATIEQIITLHNARYPDRSTPETIPLKLLHNIMLADFYEGKFDRVQETWELILRRSTERYRPAAAHLSAGNDDPEAPSRPVVRAARFRLCDPLKTMQRLHLERQDADGLLRLVASVRARGFELDSKNWNYHVQALARLKRWREAFDVCEKVLMPRWMGWGQQRLLDTGRRKLPLELRRLGSAPNVARPITHTMLTLAKEYMDLEAMRLWSPSARNDFQKITDSCPKTVRALTTMVRRGSRLEYEVFGDRGPAQGEHGDDNSHHQEDDGTEHERATRQWSSRAFCPRDPREGEGKRHERARRRRSSRAREDDISGEAGYARTGRHWDKRVYDEQVEAQERRSSFRDAALDAFTEGGFLNGPSSAKPKTKKKQDDLSEEDILDALRGGGH